jgi:TM2 domain-containing membrane protein YozV
MSEPICPYCRMAFEESGPAKVFCTACGTPHHEDCYQENGGCTVFGCSRAPADDPKLQVSQSDLSAVNLQAASQPQAYAYQPAQPSISPQAAGAWYQPSTYGQGPLGLSAAATAPAPIASAPAQTPSAPAPPPGTYFYTTTPSTMGAYAPPAAAVARQSQKSRSTFIVLGIFLGWLGIHNFYGGYTGKAIGQLCLTVLTVGFLGVISWLWALIEICVIDKDSEGATFI